MIARRHLFSMYIGDILDSKDKEKDPNHLKLFVREHLGQLPNHLPARRLTDSKTQRRNRKGRPLQLFNGFYFHNVQVVETGIRGRRGKGGRGR